MDDLRTLKFLGDKGRDAGKTFLLTEIEPLQMASFVLRLVSALRVESWEGLLAQLREYNDEDDAPAPIDEVMGLLQGCDPARVEALIHEALKTVQIAADPRHPEAFRALEAQDMRELATLGQVLVTFGKLNFDFGQ
jgi:hypothetical protein